MNVGKAIEGLDRIAEIIANGRTIYSEQAQFRRIRSELRDLRYLRDPLIPRWYTNVGWQAVLDVCAAPSNEAPCLVASHRGDGDDPLAAWRKIGRSILCDPKLAPEARAKIEAVLREVEES